jgi:hypothetical protein
MGHNRDIHQDNGELINVVQGINGNKPASCPELQDLSAKKAAAFVSATPEAVHTTSEADDDKTPSIELRCTTGHMRCSDRGQSAEYSECVNGTLMSRLCSYGTVCNTNGDYILCNHPTIEVAEKLKAAAERNGTADADVDPSRVTVDGKDVTEGVSTAAKTNNIPVSDTAEKKYDIPADVVDQFADFSAETLTISQTKSTSSPL